MTTGRINQVVVLVRLCVQSDMPKSNMFTIPRICSGVRIGSTLRGNWKIWAARQVDASTINHLLGNIFAHRDNKVFTSCVSTRHPTNRRNHSAKKVRGLLALKTRTDHYQMGKASAKGDPSPCGRTPEAHVRFKRYCKYVCGYILSETK